MERRGRLDVISIGECMVELSRAPDGRFDAACGGDTFNTAVYLSRAGIVTGYATALGDDFQSDAIAGLAQEEGIDARAIVRAPGRSPGLYMVETDPGGERRFLYWRETSPARELFGALAANEVEDAIAHASLVYFSGVTLWLYDERGIDRFFASIAAARRSGATIAFDSNYRPRLWGEDREHARHVMAAALALTDVALPTFEDEQALWDDASPRETLERFGSDGARTIALKLGKDGALVSSAGGATMVTTTTQDKVVDTTGAGDSFNAGFLAALLRGRAPVEAAGFGNRLAGIVVRHRGAIAPRSATRELLEEI